MRITLDSMVNQVMASMDQQTSQLGVLQQQADTGLQLLQASDNPAAMVQVIAGNSQNTQLTTYLSNNQTAQASLNQSMSTLQEVSNILTQAQQIASEGAQPSNGSTGAGALASQVSSLLSQMLSLANTQNNGDYIFGGTATQTPPFVVNSTTGQVTYQGASENAQVPISQGQSVATYYAGNTIFQAPAGTSGGGSGGTADVFQALTNLQDELLNTQGEPQSTQAQALSTTLGQLTSIQNNVLNVAGEQGASVQNLTGLQTQMQTVQLQTQENTGTLQNADVSQVVVNLQAEQNQLQLTLAATARLFDQNLLDYLQ